MKKYLFILISVLGTLFLNSCATDGDWEDGNNGGQFGFQIERDDNFIEKGTGEVNQLKFNLVTNYDFAQVQTTFKFTTNLNGSLKLNGQTLTPNQEYTFTSKNNIFEYVGNVSGTHDLKFTVKNSKGASKEEEFSLPYSISEFTHTFSGGIANIYQGDETNYLMKIIPGSGQPSAGYEIKFNSYSGTIKLNGVAATTGQFYTLPNIDSFNVILSTSISGQGALHYTIKNSTVSKDYSIQQEIVQRQIAVESMNINATSVTPNTPMSLIGIVKKAPITSNLNVKYKTWISASSNNNTNGIQNTNNVYVPYTLTANGSFSYNFNALQVGTYTYNIQFQDEYGNESEVKSFNVTVESQVQFIGGGGGEVGIRVVFGSPVNGYFKRFKRTFKVQAGGGSTITSMKYTVDFDVTVPSGVLYHHTRIITENVATGSNIYEMNDEELPIAEQLIGTLENNCEFSNIIIKMEATNSNGQTASKTVNGTRVIL